MLLQLGASEASCCFLLLLLSGCFPALSFEWFLGVPQLALILCCAETSLKKTRFPFTYQDRFFYWGLVGTFLALFSSLFSTSFFIGFFVVFGGILEAKMGPKIDFWSDFLDVFLEPSFLRVFLVFFHVFLKLETLKILIFPRRNAYF